MSRHFFASLALSLACLGLSLHEVRADNAIDIPSQERAWESGLLKALKTGDDSELRIIAAVFEHHELLRYESPEDEIMSSSEELINFLGHELAQSVKPRLVRYLYSELCTNESDESICQATDLPQKMLQAGHDRLMPMLDLLGHQPDKDMIDPVTGNPVATDDWQNWLLDKAASAQHTDHNPFWFLRRMTDAIEAHLKQHPYPKLPDEVTEFWLQPENAQYTIALGYTAALYFPALNEVRKACQSAISAGNQTNIGHCKTISLKIQQHAATAVELAAGHALQDLIVDSLYEGTAFQGQFKPTVERRKRYVTCLLSVLEQGLLSDHSIEDYIDTASTEGEVAAMTQVLEKRVATDEALEENCTFTPMSYPPHADDERTSE